MIAQLLHLLFRKALHPSAMYAEREKWRLRLASIGYTPENAAQLEAHRFASFRALSEQRDDPDAYAAYNRPWFEIIWRNSR